MRRRLEALKQHRGKGGQLLELKQDGWIDVRDWTDTGTSVDRTRRVIDRGGGVERVPCSATGGTGGTAHPKDYSLSLPAASIEDTALGQEERDALLEVGEGTDGANDNKRQQIPRAKFVLPEVLIPVQAHYHTDELYTGTVIAFRGLVTPISPLPCSRHRGCRCTRRSCISTCDTPRRAPH